MSHSSSKVPRRLFLLGALVGGFGPLGTLLAAPARAASPSRSAASVGPLINIPQTWNNCGPASIAEVLAYWGIARTQEQVQAVLRVDGEGAGMTPYGVPVYARELGLRALVGAGGTAELVKALLAGGLPVIVHQVVSLADPVGHWRPIEAYDDRRAVFVASDPYLGPDHVMSYAEFAQLWALRGNAFIVLYPPSHQVALNRMVAACGWNRAAAFAHDLALVKANQVDTSPAGTPAGAAAGFRFLALAWDAAQLGQAASARAYLSQARQAGANPVEVGWVAAAIG